MADEKKTILIVEDEEDFAEMYTLVLSNADFNVLQAKDGAEALALLEKECSRTDLILLDIVMPGMDGLEVLRKIKEDERFRNISVIIFTNLDNEDDRQQALEMCADDYFVKSQSVPSESVEKIKKFFAKKERANF